MSLEAADFIRRNTQVGTPPLVPEIRLHLATELTPLWYATEEALAKGHMPPPFWAFAWAGGQGMARYILDHPEEVRGRRVLDFGAGSGLAAIAAARAGATQVLAADIDPFSQVATQMNAALNGVVVTKLGAVEMDRAFEGVDLILACDVCYEQIMSHRLMKWLWRCLESGVEALLADPGRAYVPQEGLQELAGYEVAVPRELETHDTRHVRVSRLLAG